MGDVKTALIAHSVTSAMLARNADGTRSASNNFENYPELSCLLLIAHCHECSVQKAVTSASSSPYIVSLRWCSCLFYFPEVRVLDATSAQPTVLYPCCEWHHVQPARASQKALHHAGLHSPLAVKCQQSLLVALPYGIMFRWSLRTTNLDTPGDVKCRQIKPQRACSA